MLVKVLPLTVAVPKLRRPPPSSLAELLVKVLPLTVALPKLSRPPPAPAELLVKVLPLTVNVPRLRTAPPWPSSLLVPLGLLATPSPSMRSRLLRVTLVPAAISKIREFLSPLIVGVRDGTLWIVTSWLRTSSPWVSTIGSLTAAVNWMVSPLWAWATA